MGPGGPPYDEPVRRAARYLSFVGPLLVVLALSKTHASQVADPPYDYSGSARFGWSLGYAAALSLAAYGIGLPDTGRSWRQVVGQAVLASAAAAIGVSLVQLAVGDALLPRFVVFGAALGVVPLHMVAAAASQQGRRVGEDRDRVVVIGSSNELEHLVADLAMAPERPAMLAASAGVQDVAAGGLADLVSRVRATVLVLDRSALLDERIVDQAAPLHEAGVRVRTLLEFYEEWLGKLPVGELERASLFFDIGEVHRVRYGRVKRLVDVALALLGLIPLVLATGVVLVGNLVGNRGPLLYRQERVGRGGQPFEILKFRTMIPTVPGVSEGAWTQADDPRITRFGRILRISHLDELPQAINILRGDLSVVGPRPEQPRYVEELSAKLPFYGLRHLVRPGLTGWAQVKYGYAGDERDALEKLQYEFFYLRHQRLGFDARVMGRTVRSLAGSEGRGR